MNLIENLKLKNTDLHEYEIENILYVLCENNPILFDDLVHKVKIPKATVRSFLQSIASILKDSNSTKIQLSDGGLKLIKEAKFSFKNPSLLNFEDEKLESWLKNIRKENKLVSKRDLDQFFATEKTSVQKALILQNNNVSKDSNLAVLGDDDLISLVLAKIGFKNVTIFEIDDEIINLIEKVSKENKFDITCVKYNAKESIGASFTSKFDIVLTDPPYTQNGIELFVDRSLSLLKKGDLKGSYIYLNYGNSFKNYNEFFRIYNVLSKYNLVIENVLNKFNSYIGAEGIGSNSNLYILRTTEKTTPLNIDVENIYTFEEKPFKNFPFVQNFDFRLSNVDKQLLTSKSILDKKIRDFCKLHGLFITGQNLAKFEGGGLTISYTLKTSSLSVHTWPELNALHINIIVCKQVKNEGLMIKNLTNLFDTNLITKA